MPHRSFGLIAVACFATVTARAALNESQVTTSHLAAQVANDIATAVERGVGRNFIP
jgi:hypothetical protein